MKKDRRFVGLICNFGDVGYVISFVIIGCEILSRFCGKF